MRLNGSAFSGSGVQYSALSPRFGWSRKQPPEYALRLERSDFTDVSTLSFSPALVEKIVDKLVRRGDTTKPGFVLLPNLRDYTDSLDAAEAFEKRLTDAVHDYLDTHHRDVYNPTGDAFDQYGPKGPIRFPGYQPTRKKYDADGKFIYHHVKRQHCDSIVSLYSLIYSGKQNVRGGVPRLSDIYQYCKDKGLDISDVIEAIPLRPKKEAFPTLRIADEHLAPILEDYTLRFPEADAKNGFPLFIVFNQLENTAIARGSSQPLCNDRNQPSGLTMSIYGKVPKGYFTDTEYRIRKAAESIALFKRAGR